MHYGRVFWVARFCFRPLSKNFYKNGRYSRNIKQIKEILSKSYSLRNLVTDKEDKIAISKMINTLEEQQSKLVKLNNNLPEIQKQQNNHEEGLDLSGIINTLKRELIKIQNTYRDMMSDKVLDDEEFETLLNMVGKVLGNCYTAKSLATSEKDKKAILIIMNSLEELRTKMVKIQQYMQMKL